MIQKSNYNIWLEITEYNTVNLMIKKHFKNHAE